MLNSPVAAVPRDFCDIGESVYIVKFIPFVLKELFDSLAVVALKLYYIILNGAAAGEFAFQEFMKFIEINIHRIETFYDSYFLAISSLVDLHANLLLLFCYFFANAQFFW